ncbi:GNAT family N-acetyltransferase [Azorhizobium doebereinerae]|uniref:GNAT family N-acetyltransferase n=1 Tax=Azorhizobium doebereinerae TaxID=281091 RepID=UPI000418B220|nr:GNAT family N-acetyltransferase [Azorhizobium doebereinerae]
MPEGETRDLSVIFRPPVDADFAALAEMRRDPRMQAMLMSIPDRTDDEAVRHWIARRVSEPGGLFRVISEAQAQQVLGFIQVSEVNARDRFGYGAVAVSHHCRLPGVALLAMRELMRSARSELGLLKLMAEIRADNTDAIRMNHLCGYKTIGTLESHFVDAAEQRHDVILLQRALAPLH